MGGFALAIESSIPMVRGGDRLLVIGATALFCFALYRMVNYRPDYEGPGGLVAIGEVKTDTAVRRRHAGSLAWSEIEQQGPIFLRDLVYTPPGVVAEVVMEDGRHMPLPPDSLIQFDDITVSNLEITLKELATPKKPPVFRLVPLPKTKQSVALADPIYLELEHSGLAKKNALSRMRGIILQGLKKLKPVSGEFEKVDSYEVKLAYPETGLNLPFKAGSHTKVVWTPIPNKNINYVVEFSLKDNFQNAIPFASKTNTADVSLDKPGKYFWRVTAIGKGAIVKSETRIFSLYPKGSRTVAENFNLNEADKYQVEVSKSKTFDVVVTTRGASQPKCPTEGLAPGSYYCRVRDGAGKQYTLKIFPFEVKK
jgi:hypothetical protein